MRLVIFVLLGCLVRVASGQNTLLQSNLSSSGGSGSGNTTTQLYSVFGQPAAVLSPVHAQTQAGFMHVNNYTIADVIAPSISVSAIGSITPSSPPAVSATITDNVAVVSATLFYRKISESTWHSVALTGTGNLFSTAILPAWFDAMGMEYYFVAADARANSKRSPASGSYYAYVIPGEQTVTSDRMGFGINTSNYKILAMPFTTSNNSVANLFEELGDWSSAKFRMARYENNSDSFLEYPGFTTLDRGVGYWSLIKTPVTIKISPSTGFIENRSALYTMTLKPGWNMIGNPYPLTINWDDVRTLNNQNALGTIHTYNNGWTPGPTVDAYEGGFVLVSGASNITIKIPFAGQVAEGSRKTQVTPSDAWVVDMSVNQGDNTNTLGGFGMNPLSSTSWDIQDDITPPSIDTTPGLLFGHPEHPYKAFCRDVIPVRDAVAWTFEVSGKTGEQTTLSWNNVPAGKSLRLLDQINLVVIDLQQESVYSFELQPHHGFKVFYGDMPVQPDQLVATAPYPNPVVAGGLASIRVAVPNPSQGFAELQLSDITGAPVLSTKQQVMPGISTLVVHPEENQVHPGFYIYRLHIQTDAGQQVITGKLIVR